MSSVEQGCLQEDDLVTRDASAESCPCPPSWIPGWDASQYGCLPQAPGWDRSPWGCGMSAARPHLRSLRSPMNVARHPFLKALLAANDREDGVTKLAHS